MQINHLSQLQLQYKKILNLLKSISEMPTLHHVYYSSVQSTVKALTEYIKWCNNVINKKKFWT